jgi:hypothetical protein
MRVDGRYVLKTVGIVVGCAFIISTAVRLGRTSSQATGTAFGSAVSSTLAGVSIGMEHPIGLVTTAVAALVNRENMLDSLELVTEKTPLMVPYTGAREYLVLPLYALVPRIVWRGKPYFDPAAIVAHVYYGIPATQTVYIAPGLFGGMFLSFGMWSLLGMVIAGVLYRQSLAIFHGKKHWGFVRLYLWCALAVHLAYVESDPFSMLDSIAKLCWLAGAVGVIVWLTNGVQRRHGHME